MVYPYKGPKTGTPYQGSAVSFSLHTGGKLHGGRFLTKETCDLKGLCLVFFGVVFQYCCESVCGDFCLQGVGDQSTGADRKP